MRDATDYYNLFPATLKNGNKQIIYLYNKRYDALEKGKYINVSTGCLITRNSPFYKSKDFYFYDDDEFPLCYKFSCRGLARLSVIRKILKFYADGLREYERTKDEEKMKELVDNEVEAAKRNYEYLNKKNNGYDDLQLFNIPPHINEPEEEEDSVNSSSLKDNNNSYNNNNSFINDGEIEEEEEGEEEEEYNDNDNDNNNDNENDNENGNDNEEEDGEENKDENDETNKKEEENNKKRKGKLLIKNFNKNRKELDDLKENNDGEDDLNKNEEEENENDSDIIKISFKKKKLCKSKFLNKKIKRNIITDSDDENNEKEEEKEEKEEKNEKENEEEKLNENIVENIEVKAEINLEKKIEEKIDDKIEQIPEIKNILKKKEEKLKYYDIFNNIKNNKTKEYKINKIKIVPSKQSKLKQRNLNSFLKIIQ